MQRLTRIEVDTSVTDPTRQAGALMVGEERIVLGSLDQVHLLSGRTASMLPRCLPKHLLCVPFQSTDGAGLQ